jgi:hypothetical protein
MGRRTDFYENITGKSCKDLLVENYSTFSQWFLKEYGVSSSNQKLTGFLHTNTSGVFNLDKPYSAIIDEMLPSFITCISKTRNSEYYCMLELAEKIRSLTQSKSKIIFRGTGHGRRAVLFSILKTRSLL